MSNFLNRLHEGNKGSAQDDTCLLYYTTNQFHDNLTIHLIHEPQTVVLCMFYVTSHCASIECKEHVLRHTTNVALTTEKSRIASTYPVRYFRPKNCAFFSNAADLIGALSS